MWKSLAIVALLITLSPVSAWAQRRAPAVRPRVRPVPSAGMNAVGISAGVALPSEELFSKGPTLAVSAEHYFSARVSLRGQLSGAFWHFTDFEEDTSRPVAVTGDVVYNWERGTWHPYVMAGVGFYKFRFKEADFDASDSAIGLNFGGGAEYFLSRHDSLTGEVTVHAISGDATGRFADYGTSYWTITGGYKKYF
ncbi:MAG: outer membrane beta-barrel protein [Vicinamibacterales bacterium]